jgi:nucleoside diphosphate kinase
MSSPSTASSASFLTDHTLCVVKPSAFAHRQAIASALTNASFTIVASRELTLNRAQAHRLYYEIASHSEFSSFIDHICSGPMAVFHVQKINSDNANEALKQLLGPENPSLALILSPSSLRALYGQDSPILNGLHCPHNLLAVHNELDCFFHTEPKRIILFGPPSSGKVS